MASKNYREGPVGPLSEELKAALEGEDPAAQAQEQQAVQRAWGNTVRQAAEALSAGGPGGADALMEFGVQFAQAHEEVLRRERPNSLFLQELDRRRALGQG